ncbi:hypothetical protein [Streptomyces goshikiensis]|uniref:hypothetical protein n=1 Tax=Streptomyces goshikiensis TaxID=1942 RepID=UPI00331E2D3C
MSGLAAVELAEPFTFVIDSVGVPRVAPRRSEHVVCAGGGPVLGAGEIVEALDAAGIEHPSGFTHEVVFRCCPACSQLNIVWEGDFVCVFWDGELPREWNVDGSGS